ncbi:M16 family metallopeptidase [Marinifilum caeruleilacunae]|uniref:Insulinase family protein n=1 Tax=Marinifilum caeruleilacunae TaxID=2499076 RepID=A0ABX1WWM6_9BACT|nr:M16 family metallopeptidase [Marinifilum caeruleilacunae]NOU60396.1 insulinase family protein [Marinifilum caeruleilacunae]
MIKNLLGKATLCGTLLLAGTAMLSAQKNGSSELPLDPNVRTGKLENGLTYYVRHNEEPKDRASFYIVQNVGAILENDDQNGLAHFLEHMAFNGTENFPGKGVLNYLEKYGVAFGRNINAYTNVDETVYNLSNIPTSNENLLDSALLVLHDWSNYLSLEGEEIDSERGVIREEWRTRRSGGMRAYLEQSKVIYKGSKYAKRDVIGSLDVINNFDHKVIRDFYHDWYRTDLQAIIVVGDIDAEKFEQKIKEMFAHIPAVENPKERVYYDVPGNKEAIVGIITDPEVSNYKFDIFYKHKATPFKEKNLQYYRNSIIENLHSSILGNRLNELLQKGNAPFINAFGAYYNRARKMDVYHNSVTLKEDNLLGGIETFLKEIERANKHGVVATELERAKTEMLSRVEKQYKDRNKQNNDRLVRGYTRHYLVNEPAPGIEFEFEAMKKLLPGITAEEVNAFSKKWMTKENIIITFTAPEKEGVELPSEEQLLAVVDKVKKAELKPYVDKVITEPLIAETPKAGNVSKEAKLDAFEATEWTLANGAKVVVKKTDFKENEIRMQAFSTGGNSLYAVEDLASAEMAGGFIANFGLGKFDQTSLQKLLTGKSVRVAPYISELSEGFNGNSSVKDFETMLQLLHMYFVAPRFDNDAFTALKGRYKAYVANMGTDVNKAFRDSVSTTTTDHHPRTILFNTKMIESLDLETMKRVYQERFVDASDFTFVFVGNIDIAKAKPMIETYIGSIKDIDREENWKDNGVDYPEKDTYNHFSRAMETPKTTIHIDLHGDIKYTRENRIMMNVVSELLDKRYTDVIREQEGGTYGVGVRAYVDKFPREEYNLIVRFDTDPAKADKLKGIVYDEIQALFTKGIKEDDLVEAKKNFVKEYQENLRKNGYWINAINRYYRYDESVMSVEDYEKMINSISKEKVEKFAKKYFTKPGKVEVVMSPKQ